MDENLTADEKIVMEFGTMLEYMSCIDEIILLIDEARVEAEVILDEYQFSLSNPYRGEAGDELGTYFEHYCFHLYKAEEFLSIGKEYINYCLQTGINESEEIRNVMAALSGNIEG